MRVKLVVALAVLLIPDALVAQGVEFMWSGGATHESIVVKARLDTERFVRLAVSKSANLSNPVLSGLDLATGGNDQVVSLSVSGLIPGTKYYYGIVELDNSVNEPFGSFRTFPAPGCQDPYDFTVALGGQ